MKFFQGKRYAVGVFGENDICDQCLCIHIRFCGEDKNPLFPAGETADFLTQLPIKDNWDKDLSYVLLCLLSLIFWLLTNNYLYRVL